MLKKLLASMMSILMLLTVMMALPVSAADMLPDNIGTDYVANEEARFSNNMITDGSAGIMNYAWNGDYTYKCHCANVGGSMEFGQQSETEYFFRNAHEDMASLIGDGTSYPVHGFNVKTAAPEDATGRVVFSLRFRANPSPEAVVNVGRRNKAASTNEYSIEYNGDDQGIVPDSTGKYSTLVGTFADTGAAADQYTYSFGFAKGTANGAVAYFDTASAYIGYEYAYDMSLTPASQTVLAGYPVDVSVSVINQIGNAYGGDNSVSWYAATQDRSTAVDGFAFTDNEDGTYAVSVDSSVAGGTYRMIAVSNANEEIVKSFEIEVEKNPYEDSFADETTRYSNNMITPGADGPIGVAWDGKEWTYEAEGITGAFAEYAGTASGEYYFKNLVPNVSDTINKDYPVLGFRINKSNPENAAGRVVFSFKLRANNSPKAVLNIIRKNSDKVNTSEYVEYPIEYNGADQGIEPTTTSTAVTGTFADTGSASDKYSYRIGFAKGTEASAVAYFDPATAYIGYEYVYDMSLTPASKTMSAGFPVNVSVSVVNQIGNAYGGNDNVLWYAATQDRTETLDGFTFTDNEDGTYTVSVAPSVEEGTYRIIAISSANQNVVKSFEIEVKKNPYEDSVADETTRYSNNMITPGADGPIGVAWDGKEWTYEAEGITGAFAEYAGTASGEYYFKNLVSDVSGTINKDYPVLGFRINKSNPENAAGRVVFSFKLRANDSPKAVLNIIRKNSDKVNTSEYVEYPIEYNGADQGIEPTTTSTAVTGTFADTGSASDKYSYRIGFAKGTEASAVAYFDPATAYIGYEYVYDMSLTPASKTMSAGFPVDVSVSVLNQIGNAYGGDGSVLWYAATQDGSAAVDGFAFTDNEDGTYTVSVAPSVAEGTYRMIAVSNANEEIIKSFEIEVNNDSYKDHVVDQATRYSSNMITDGSAGLINYSWIGDYTYKCHCANENGSMDFGQQSGDEYYFRNLHADMASLVGDGTTFPVHGFNVKTTAPESATGKVVFSLRFRANESPNAIVNIARRNKSTSQNEYPVEYNGDDQGIIPASNGSYTTLSGIFADTGAAADQYTYSFGFAKGTDQGAVAYFDTASAYIGYEYAYDMIVTSDAKVVKAGSTFSVAASVINQVGNTYSGDTTITWKALSTDRKSEIAGITITPGENGTATVEIAETVADGTYDIVAVFGDKVMSKGVSVAVLENGAESLMMLQSGGKITIITPDVLTAKLVVVTYTATTNGKYIMKDFDIIDVELSENDVKEYNPDVLPGTKTKAMLWTDMGRAIPLTEHIEY